MFNKCTVCVCNVFVNVNVMCVCMYDLPYIHWFALNHYFFLMYDYVNIIYIIFSDIHKSP